MEERTYCLFLVDDSIVNLIVGESILQEKYSVLTIPSGEKLFSAMKKTRPDMILLDIEMPGMSGFDVIKELKAAPETKDIPVIFLTGETDPVNEVMGRSLGAVDYILKPYNPQHLLGKIELYFRTQKTEPKTGSGNNRVARKLTELSNKSIVFFLGLVKHLGS